MGSSGQTLGRVRGQGLGISTQRRKLTGPAGASTAVRAPPSLFPFPPPCWCLRTFHLACSLASFLPRHRPQHVSYVSCTPPLAWPMSPKDHKSHTCQPLISARIQLRPRTPSGYFRERAQCRKCFHKQQKKGKKQNTE